MCGRFTLTVSLGEIKERYQVAEADEIQHEPRFNVAPTQTVPVVGLDKEGSSRLLMPMRWGLIPGWSKDPSIGNRLINARAESLSSKPSFRHPFRRQRCLIPVDGFYEWTRDERGKKQPWRIFLKGKPLFAFAGLWDRWMKPGGEAWHTFTIITTRPNEKMAAIHNRMPVILHREAEAMWLDPQLEDPAALAPLLDPYPAEEMEYHQVSTLVNSPRNDRPECIQPLSG